MPRATDDRPVVGTSRNPCEVCDTTKTFKQVQRGTRKGYLYSQCGCGATQNDGKPAQLRFLKEIVWRDVPGILQHPLADKGEGIEREPEQIEKEPVQEPEPGPKGTPSKKRGLVFLGLLGAAAFAIFH